MSINSVYGDLYDESPELVISERLKHSGKMKDIVKIAEENNYRVKYGSGRFRFDMIAYPTGEGKSKGQQMTYRQGIKFFGRMDES